MLISITSLFKGFSAGEEGVHENLLWTTSEESRKDYIDNLLTNFRYLSALSRFDGYLIDSSVRLIASSTKVPELSKLNLKKIEDFLVSELVNLYDDDDQEKVKSLYDDFMDNQNLMYIVENEVFPLHECLQKGSPNQALDAIQEILEDIICIQEVSGCDWP